MPSIAVSMGDAFIRRQISLLRLDAGERRKIIKSLLGLQADLLKKLDDLDGLTPNQSRRLIAIFKAADEVIRQRYSTISKQHQQRLYEMAKQESEQTQAIANRVIGVDLLTVGVTQETLKALVNDDLVQGAPAKEWWSRQAASLQSRFKDTIRRGVFAGETLSDLTRRVRGTRERKFQDGIMSLSTRHAEALIRTSVQSITNAARYETLKANDDVLDGQQWLTTLDPRTCPQCMNYSQAAWDFEGNSIGDNRQDFPGPPPLHFSCFPGDALVTSCDRITGKTQRWYEGELVIIRTAAGHELTCTPNHPILTRQGWAPAHLLKKGHDVVRSLGPEWRPGGDPDNDNMPTRIEDCAVAPFGSFGVESGEVPIAAEDFHGDVVGSKVAVITTNGQLRSQGKPALGQHGLHGLLGLRHTNSQAVLETLCPAMAGHVRPSRATEGIMGRLGQGLPLLRRQLGLANKHRFTTCASGATGFCQSKHNRIPGDTEAFTQRLDAQSLIVELDEFLKGKLAAPTARRNPSLSEPTPDTGFADAKLASEIWAGHAGPVAADKIVDVHRKFFHGYVYNLETVTGFYVVNSIIVHNCRCTLVPVLKSWEQLAKEAKGNTTLAKKLDEVEDDLPRSTQASMDGQIGEDISYDEWLKQQDEATQIEALGKGKWELWKKGDIGLTDMVDQFNRPLSLAAIREAV